MNQIKSELISAIVITGTRGVTEISPEILRPGSAYHRQIIKGGGQA